MATPQNSLHAENRLCAFASAATSPRQAANGQITPDFAILTRISECSRLTAHGLSGRYATAPIVQWLMSHSRPLNWGKRTNAYVERAARMGIHLSLVCSHMRAFLGCVTTVADTHPYCLGSRTKSFLPQLFVSAVGRKWDGSGQMPRVWKSGF